MSIKLTIEDIRRRLILSDLDCMEEEYRSPYLKMKFRCQRGHDLRMSWTETQKFIKQKKPHCQICKNGKFFKNSKQVKDTNNNVQLVASDGSLFDSRKELIKYNRKLKIANSPHERAIENIRNNTIHAKKYKFKKNVIFSIAKWNLIEKLKTKNQIYKYDLKTNNKQIIKEIYKPLCSNCDGDAGLCGCDSGVYNHYSFVEGEIGKIINFVPDLYSINEENCVISAYEVEESHRVPIAKIIDYANFDNCLDWYFPDWKFNLYIYDRFENKMGTINLPVYFIAGLSSDIAKNYISILENCEMYADRIENEIISYYKTAPFYEI